MQLLDIFFKSYRKQVLALLLEAPGRSFHVREIARQSQLAPGTLHRELGLLSGAGLVNKSKLGNQLHYTINTLSPVYPELRGLFAKLGQNQEGVVDQQGRRNEQELVTAMLQCVDSILGSYNNKIQFFHSAAIQDAIRFRIMHLLELVRQSRKLGHALKQQLLETLQPLTVYDLNAKPVELWDIINEQLPSFRALLTDIHNQEK